MCMVTAVQTITIKVLWGHLMYLQVISAKWLQAVTAMVSALIKQTPPQAVQVGALPMSAALLPRPEAVHI